MKTPITILINDTPLPKGRPRFGRNGAVYTPASTRAYEQSIGWAAKYSMRGQRPFAGPVKLEIDFALPVPRSWLKPRRGAAPPYADWPIAKPDIDNLIKAALDAINQIVLDDDSQVVELIARKRYNATPRLCITCTPLEDEGRP